MKLKSVMLKESPHKVIFQGRPSQVKSFILVHSLHIHVYLLYSLQN